VTTRKSPPPTIRQYRRTDDEQIRALTVTTDPADLPDIVDRYLRTGGDFLVAEIDGEIVGTAGLLPTGKATADVVMVRVHPGWRRRGIGTALVEAVESRAEGLGVHQLNLDVGNEPEAIAFYLASGFRQPDNDDEPDRESEPGTLSKALKFLP
jgi:N-acetylglutamate synthase-like GNAT family acetyltransferase